MTKKPKKTESQLLRLVLHTKGQRDRLVTANRSQVETIFALSAALREVHAILRSKSSGHTDAERVEMASRHIVAVTERFANFMPSLGEGPNSTIVRSPVSPSK